MFRLPLGEGLALQLLEGRHAQELHALVEANRDHLDRWFPWVSETRSVIDTAAFIDRSLARFRRGDGFDAGIVVDGRLRGCVGLHFVKRPEGVTEIGYWLAEDAQGAGVMTRTLQGLLPHLFRDLDLHRVEIRCDPANARSRALPERLGFDQEGVLRGVGMNGERRYDHVVYALLRPDWEGTRSGAGPTPR